MKKIPMYPDYTISPTGEITKDSSPHIPIKANVCPELLGDYPYAIAPMINKYGNLVNAHAAYLVAQAYLPKPKNAYYALHHKDGDLTNIAPTNLEWRLPPHDDIRELTPQPHSFKSKVGVTGYIGVSTSPKIAKVSPGKPYKVQIYHDGKMVGLGYYATAREGAERYDEVAKGWGHIKTNITMGLR